METFFAEVGSFLLANEGNVSFHLLCFMCNAKTIDYVIYL